MREADLDAYRTARAASDLGDVCECWLSEDEIRNLADALFYKHQAIGLAQGFGSIRDLIAAVIIDAELVVNGRATPDEFDPRRPQPAGPAEAAAEW